MIMSKSAMSTAKSKSSIFSCPECECPIIVITNA